MADYKQLYEACEQKSSVLEKMVDNQNQLIANLQKTNDYLTMENEKLRTTYQELLASYDKAVDLCNRQQELLDAMFDKPEVP